MIDGPSMMEKVVIMDYGSFMNGNKDDIIRVPSLLENSFSGVSSR